MKQLTILIFTQMKSPHVLNCAMVMHACGQAVTDYRRTGHHQIIRNDLQIPLNIVQNDRNSRQLARAGD